MLACALQLEVGLPEELTKQLGAMFDWVCQDGIQQQILEQVWLWNMCMPLWAYRTCT
jgi:hypothetical protein